MQDPTVTNDPAVADGAPVLHAVPIRSLCVGTVTGFDLYLPSGADGNPVLFRGKNHPFTESVRQRLEESNVELLYIDVSQRSKYYQYVEQHLDQILRDPALDMDGKASILYQAMQNRVEEVMSDPRSPVGIRRIKNVVSSTIRFIVQERAVLEHLFKVASIDYHVYTHSVNVFVLSIAMAQRKGIGSVLTLRRLGEGFLLHDIGKSQIDPAITHCTGVLTDEQWQIMKKHPLLGFDLLVKHENISQSTLDIVRHHHEKITGMGYPDGIEGSFISPEARLCAIADIFDALTTRRVYREPLGSFQALKLMQDEMSDDLDADLFRLFVEMMGNPAGN